MIIPDCKISFLSDSKLPLVVMPSDPNMTYEQFITWLGKEKNALKKALLKYGGLLFRKFPIRNENEFSDAIKALDVGHFLDYIGGDSPRVKVVEGVYTSTEAPPAIKIPLHNELSFVKNYPKYIHFYCETPSAVGGATILGDARKIFKEVDIHVKERLQKKRIRYSSCYYHESKIMEALNKWQPSHKSWKQVFETASKENVESKCRANDFDFQWNRNNWLKIEQLRPATIEHPETAEPVWFNQVHLYDFNPKLLGWWRYLGAKLFYFQDHMKLHQVFFGDGERIPRQDLYHIMDVLDKNTVSFPWKKQDYLILDNVLSMHGRAPFEGKRRVLAAMTG